MALGSFTLAVLIYCGYEFVHTQNLVYVAVPAVLVLVSGVIIGGQKRKQE